MNIDQPVAASDVEWGRSVDVIIVGLGAAGACAALEAQRAGADVLVLERASGGGGASAASEGIFYLGGGTDLQKDLGYQDSAENMYSFMRASTTTKDEVSLRRFCEGAADHFAWLEHQGLRFERRAFTKKAVAVRTGEGLLTTGNEKMLEFAKAATPAPRGHQAQGTAQARGGVSAMQALVDATEQAGVPVMYDLAFTGLVIEEDGSVCGVQVHAVGEGRSFIEARNAVIVATGSFNLNAELCHQHLPVVAANGRPLGIESNDGSGLLISQTVGVDTTGMDGVIATSSIYPPEELIFGVIVNKLGQRFVAEDSYHGRTAYQIERQPDQLAWLLVDEAHFAYPERGQELVDVFETAKELEAALGFPEGSVATSVSTYNHGVASGVDALGKHPNWLTQLTFPLAAFDLSFTATEYSYISLGGLATDEWGRALDGDGAPVIGLYAVGAVAAHFPQSGNEYASGMSLGPGTFFGRRAGQHACRSQGD